MTVDRDQTRRDIEVVSKWTMRELHPAAQQFAIELAEACDGLLSELEQAERENSDLEDDAVTAERKLLAAEARLAKVPALVEALRAYEANFRGVQGMGTINSRASDALAVWEQE